MVLDLDSLEFQQVRLKGFSGTLGDSILNVVGFTGSESGDGIELYVTNFRPSVDPSTGQIFPDQTATGANATIEVFRAGERVDTLDWVHTIADAEINTPNRVAAVSNHGIYVTNDHGSRKIGIVGSHHSLLSLLWDKLTSEYIYGG